MTINQILHFDLVDNVDSGMKLVGLSVDMLDGFEFSGYSPRNGVVMVDFSHLNRPRSIKTSGVTVSNFIQKKGFEDENTEITVLAAGPKFGVSVNSRSVESYDGVYSVWDEFMSSSDYRISDGSANDRSRADFQAFYKKDFEILQHMRNVKLLTYSISWSRLCGSEAGSCLLTQAQKDYYDYLKEFLTFVAESKIGESTPEESQQFEEIVLELSKHEIPVGLSYDMPELVDRFEEYAAIVGQMLRDLESLPIQWPVNFNHYQQNIGLMRALFTKT